MPNTRLANVDELGVVTVRRNDLPVKSVLPSLIARNRPRIKGNAALRLCSRPRACRAAVGLFTKPSTLKR